MKKEETVYRKVTTRRTEEVVYKIPDDVSTREKKEHEQALMQVAKEVRNSPSKVPNRTSYKRSSDEARAEAKRKAWEKEKQNFIQWFYDENPKQFANSFKFRIKKELGGIRNFKFIIRFQEVSMPEVDEPETVRQQREMAKRQIIFYTQRENEENIEKRCLTLPEEWGTRTNQLANILQLSGEVIEEVLEEEEKVFLENELNTGKLNWITF